MFDSALTAARVGELIVRTAHRDATFLIELGGELDVATVPRLRAAIVQSYESRAAVCVVDLSALRVVDPTGLQLLVALHADLARDPLRRLVLLRGGPNVQRAIAVAGLAHALPFSPIQPQTE